MIELIPRIIHLTFKEYNEKINFIIECWKNLNPDYEIKIYNDIDNDNFINSCYPEYLDVYNNFPKKICKIDFIRLLYLDKYGGIYSDIDILPLKSLNNLLNISNTILCCEDNSNSLKFNKKYIISNALIMSVKDNPFIKLIVKHIVNSINYLKISNFTDILNITGPLLFNKIYEIYKNEFDITLLDSFYFNPFTYNDLINNNINKNISLSFGIHLFDGSWWQDKYTSNMKLINNLMDNYKRQTLPLISCLCITQNNFELLSRSIQCFKDQIYDNKELIIVYESNNNIIENIKLKYNDSNIKFYEVNIEPKRTLGFLRNISILVSKGIYICQWDDDDWFSQLRLYDQYYNIIRNNSLGSIMDKWFIYDTYKNKLYLSYKRKWEGSIMYKKDRIPQRYKHLSKGEDKYFVESLKNVSIVKNYNLYVYNIHNNNTWDYDIHIKQILNNSTLYKNNHLIEKIKLNNI